MLGIGQLTAPNQSIEGANGVHYAYRRFGTPRPGTVPVVFLQHYRGNLDNWDPALIDPIADEHEVPAARGVLAVWADKPRSFNLVYIWGP